MKYTSPEIEIHQLELQNVIAVSITAGTEPIDPASNFEVIVMGDVFDW